MNIFSMKIVGPDRDVQPRTFTNDMNWAPYPAPDGRHFLYVRIVEGNNWELFLGDLAGGEPVRLTYNPGFDGMGAFSPNGKKMVFTRSEAGGGHFMAGLYSYVMDVSSLNVGPENYRGVPPKAEPPAGWQPDPAFAAWR
jgi:Tol biopolymer transport system component